MIENEDIQQVLKKVSDEVLSAIDRRNKEKETDSVQQVVIDAIMRHRVSLFKMFVEIAVRDAHETATRKGFWKVSENKGEKIANMHEELSELLRAFKRPGQDKDLPKFMKAEVEAADVIIYLLDFSGKFKLRLADAIVAKMRFNMTRDHMHGRKF